MSRGVLKQARCTARGLYGLTLVLVVGLLAGCGTGALSITDGAPVRIIQLDPPRNVIQEPLAEDIRYTLRGIPDRKVDGGKWPQRRPVLSVDAYVLDVMGDDLILVEGNGWRSWRLVGLTAKLRAIIQPMGDAYNPAAIEQPLEGDLFPSPPPSRR